MRKHILLALFLGLVLLAVGSLAEGKTKVSINGEKEFMSEKPLYILPDGDFDVSVDRFGYMFSLTKPVSLNLELELVEGEPLIRDLFEIVKNGEGKYTLWVGETDKISAPCEAVLRMTGENEEYYLDETFPIKIEWFNGKGPRVSRSVMQVPLGIEVSLDSMFEELLDDSSFDSYSVFPGEVGDKVEKVRYGVYIFHEKGVYPCTFKSINGNIGKDTEMTVYAGDYPYLLSAESGAFPGTAVQIKAEPLMTEAEGKKIIFSTEGNEACSIDEQGVLSIGENAVGTVTVRAKPEKTELEAAELTLTILGYTGTKEKGEFSEESSYTLDMWENNPFYITPQGNVWGYWQYFGTSLTLEGNEKVTKLSVTPVSVKPGREKLVNVEKDVMYLDQSMLFNTDPETATYCIVAEGAKHYAQRVLTIHTERIPDSRNPKTEQVVFVKPGESVNLYDFITTYPEKAEYLAMVEADKKNNWTSNYSHETGRKNIDLVTESDKKAIFTAHEEGRYPVLYVFAYGILWNYQQMAIICSDTLKEEDFAFTIQGGEIAAGQKITFEPVFANPDLVNSKMKNAGVDWSISYNGGSLQDYGSMQKDTFTAKGTLDDIKELTVTYTSQYCPTQSATATIVIHPKASGIEASIDREALFLLEGKETASISAAALPDTALQKFKYASSNAKVASVDENGLVTALSAGKSVITVTVDDGSQKKATFNVTVAVPVTALELSVDETRIEAGKSRKIKAVLTPEKPTNGKITWSVAEPEMADFVSVSREGAVTVKKNCPAGKVTIAAAAEGAMPDQEVRAEIELEIVGTETK